MSLKPRKRHGYWAVAALCLGGFFFRLSRNQSWLDSPLLARWHSMISQPRSQGISPTTSVDRNFQYFQADGVVTGANQATNDLAYLLSCWQAKNLTKDQQEQYQFHVVDVNDYGAIGDGQVLNTLAFQRAFEEASSHVNAAEHQSQSIAPTKLAIVAVRSGIYKIGGTVDIYSNTFLYIDETAVVIGDFAESSFPYPQAWESEGNPLYPRGILPILVRAKNQYRVGIFGQGTLDGGALPGYINGFKASMDKFEPHNFRQSADPPCQGECRPQLVLLERCDTVVVQDVTLQNSPDWTLHVRGTSDGLFTRLRVHGDWRWPNNDGIDIDSCHNVTLSHSTIQTADDAICVKTTKGYGTLDNLLVYNNKVKSRSSAFKIGSSTQEDVTNVFVDRLAVMAGTNRGIAIQHRDKGNIQNIHIRDVVIDGTEIQPIAWWGTGEPIYITSNPRYEKDWPLGRVSHVTVEKVRARSISGTSFLSYRPGPNPTSRAAGNSNKKDISTKTRSLSHLTFLDIKICTKPNPAPWDPSGAITYSQPSQDFQPTDLQPLMVPYEHNSQIGWFLNNVLFETAEIRFEDSEVFFPAQPSTTSFTERSSWQRTEYRLSQGNTLTRRNKVSHGRTSVCVEGDSKSLRGLTCLMETPCPF